MAKVELNAITQHLRGRVGDVVFRQLNGKLVASLRPKAASTPPKEGQLAHRARFKAAAAYASAAAAAPETMELYARVGAARGIAPYSAALGDYFNPPEVVKIDFAQFNAAADATRCITIRATDDAAVKAVGVLVRAAHTGTILAEGEALPANDAWRFTIALSGDAPVSIEVTARDHAGNADTKSAAWP